MVVASRFQGESPARARFHTEPVAYSTTDGGVGWSAGEFDDDAVMDRASSYFGDAPNEPHRGSTVSVSSSSACGTPVGFVGCGMIDPGDPRVRCATLIGTKFSCNPRGSHR